MIPENRKIVKYLTTLVNDNKDIKGKMFFLTVSGAHMYGFASKNSDIDYRGSYIATTDVLHGILYPQEHITITRGTDDIQLFEIRKFIELIMKMNCNMWEHLYSDRTMILKSNEFLEFRDLVEPLMSKDNLYRSYGGMAHDNYNNFIKTGKDYSVKKFLYVIRATLAGIYVLRKKRIEPDINRLNKYHGNDEILNILIDLKKRGMEKDQLDPVSRTAERVHNFISHIFIELEDAYKKSNLKPEMTVEDYHVVNNWLKKLRRDDIT